MQLHCLLFMYPHHAAKQKSCSTKKCDNHVDDPVQEPGSKVLTEHHSSINSSDSPALSTVKAICTDPPITWRPLHFYKTYLFAMIFSKCIKLWVCIYFLCKLFSFWPWRLWFWITSTSTELRSWDFTLESNTRWTCIIFLIFIITWSRNTLLF